MSCTVCNTIDLATRKPILTGGCDLDCIPVPFNTNNGRKLQDVDCAECFSLFNNWSDPVIDRGDVLQNCLAKCRLPTSAGGVAATEKEVKESNQKTLVISLILIILIIALVIVYIL